MDKLKLYQEKIKNCPDIKSAFDILHGMDLIFSINAIRQKFNLNEKQFQKEFRKWEKTTNVLKLN